MKRLIMAISYAVYYIGNFLAVASMIIAIIFALFVLLAGIMKFSIWAWENWREIVIIAAMSIGGVALLYLHEWATKKVEGDE